MEESLRQVVCVFRRPVFFSDSLLALRAGPVIHVELLPVDTLNPENTLSYTSYVGHPFGVSISTKRTFDNETCVGLVLEVSPAEHENLVSYLHDLCEANIPYNYQDMAIMALPRTLFEAVIDDIPSEDPRDIRSLFCSQAVLLALRNSLADDNPLLEVLSKVVSRTIFPYTLFHLLRPFAHTIDCRALASGLVVLRPLSEPL
jgi:hypothetical protein